MAAHSVVVTYKKTRANAGKWRPQSIIGTLQFWSSDKRDDIESITVNGVEMSKEHWKSQLLIMGIE